MRKIFFVIPLIYCFQVSAQKEESHIKLQAAYLGSIFYPGCKIGLEYKLNEKVLYHSADSLTINKSQSVTTHVGFYYHKNYHTNTYLTFGYLWRRTNRRGWFADVEPQLGISRTIIDGTSYSVIGDDVQKVNWEGDWFAVAQLSFSIGKTLKRTTKNKLPIHIYGRPSMIMLFPYNNYFYLRPTVEAGILLTIKNR